MEPLALKLVMVQGPREGETLNFRPGSKLRIGRVVRGNNITIKDSGISSKHLSIDSESGKWVLRDLDSSNGTVLNGTSVSLDTPLDLCDGDEIKMGEYTKITVKIDGYEESRARRNPRRGAVVAVAETSVGPVAESRARRNPRRGAVVAVAETSVGRVAESRSRRGRVEKESEVKSELEKENCEESEVLVKPRRGRPPKARGLKNAAADEMNVEDDEASEGLNLEEERHENVSGEKGANGSGSGSGVNESCDLEKMTLGEWFDFLEVYLPKQIIDETEEAIAEMVEKAKRLRDYMARQQEKGHVPIG